MLDSDPEDDPVPPPPRRMMSPTPPPAKRPASTSPPPKRPEKTWGALLTRMKPDAPKGALRRKIPPAKSVDKPPLETAHRKWLPRDEWLAKKRKEEEGGNADGQGFDIRVHGYWMTRANGLVYRCPDGQELRAEGVDAFWPKTQDTR